MRTQHEGNLKKEKEKKYNHLLILFGSVYIYIHTHALMHLTGTYSSIANKEWGKLNSYRKKKGGGIRQSMRQGGCEDGKKEWNKKKFIRKINKRNENQVRQTQRHINRDTKMLCEMKNILGWGTDRNKMWYMQLHTNIPKADDR